MTSDALLTTEQVAEMLGMSTDAVRMKRYRGDGPAFIRLGHSSIRYRASAVDAWLDTRTVAPDRG